MRSVKTTMRKQSGIALITTLLLLLLMSAMVVGFMLLVTEGQRLSGMNNEQSRAFYGAESGMEKLTADLGTLFGTTYAPSGPQIDFLATKPPVLPASTGVSYVDVLGASTYSIAYPKDGKGNPQAQFAQIKSGSSAFEGMTAFETTYTLTVAARTKTGGEAKLVRTTQTVGIPLFQFGVYCDGDCSFFPGPDFNFGGRVHTNGNLFLNSGGPAGATPADFGIKNELWLSSPVTASKDIFRDCLSNTTPESTIGPHPGSVEITKGGGAFQALGFGQGSLTGCLGTPKNSSWPSISASFNGNLRSGVKPLNMTITLLGASRPVEIIRRPVQGELSANPGVLGERYFSQASLRILISDNAADIINLPCVSAGAPFNLADIALPVLNWTTPNAKALSAAMIKAGTIPLPLAASGAGLAAATYVQGYVPVSASGNAATGIPGGDGYWQWARIPTQPTVATPTITGYIKIDEQTNYGAPCGNAVDVTQEILSLGYAGRNINPISQSLDGATLSPMWADATNAAYLGKMELGKAPALPILPTALTTPNLQLAGQNGAPTATVANAIFTGPSTNPITPGYTVGTCLDPHPNAVIRLERIRDNPSSVNFQSGNFSAGNLPLQSTVAEVCGVDPGPGANNGKLAILRKSPTSVPASGLVWPPQPSDFWPNVLFDTREGTLRDVVPAPPLDFSVTLGGTMQYIELDVNNLARWFSGAIGATGGATRDPNVAPNDFVVYVSDRRGNYSKGTANGTGTWPPLSPTGNETGVYGFSDFVNPADINACPNNTLDTGEDLGGAGTLFTYGAISFPPGLVDSTGTATAKTLFPNTLTATQADPNCKGPNGGLPWPGTHLWNSNEGRENPSALFRRALKLVNGGLITLPLCPGAVSCGLTITTENPVYVQGDYNANFGNNGFAAPNVAASVVGDALTLLSAGWNDVNSFASPYQTAGRIGGTTWYRMGVVAGKGLSFPIPAWNTPALNGSQDFGTDGGVHNFMRYIENWNGTLNYTGSIISMYNNHQAIGLFKCCNTIYSPPTRGYTFDSNFLNPLLLPPRTPMFRDINTTGFTQLLLPNQ